MTSGARWRKWCRRGRFIILKTRCRTRRCGIWRPKSPAKRFSANCTRNCRINPLSRPIAGPSARINLFASSRRFLSSAKASATSCSAQVTLPRSVLGFDVLLYLSLALDALPVAFQDRTPSVQMTESMIPIATVMAACLILLLVYFVWLAAQRRKNWPRWALVASLVLSMISLVQIIGDGGLQLDSGIEIVSCALTAAGLYFSFTGDARGWFNA